MPSENTILIIDDESNLRYTLSLILQRAGYQVTTAASPKEARQFFQSGPYDLVFLDLKMPEEDGLVFLPEIRRMFPDMPVMILTAHATLNSAIEAVRLGARDYILKPIDPEEILNRTKEMLAQTKVPQRRRKIVSQIQELLGELGGTEQPAAQSDDGQPKTPDEDPNRYLRRGPLALDMFTRHAILEGRDIAIPPTTFDFLVTMLRHSPSPVPYETLVAESQGYNLSRIEACEMARWQIHELRKALEPDPAHPRLIITVRDIGYRLIV
jgi:DNA-binding response OmpR family regulator